MDKEIIKSLKWRYATKIFDSNKMVSNENLNTILESARLSPSSIGAEMWKFIVVTDKKIRIEIDKASYNQPQIMSASHLIILAYRTDIVENLVKERLERTAKIQKVGELTLTGLKTMLENTILNKKTNGTLETWIKSQIYIPLGIMIETASLLEIDNCPMEGFKSDEIDEILKLKQKNLKSITILALGYRGDDPTSKRPKVRRDFNDVVEFI